MMNKENELVIFMIGLGLNLKKIYKLWISY